jgi:hypothetical protein
MLAFQVAAGIVLAYAIIINQKKLLVFGGWLLGVVATLGAIWALLWAGTAAVQFVGAHITPKLGAKLLTLLTIFPVFVLAFTATLGLLMLGGLIMGKKPRLVARGLFAALDSDKPSESNRAGCAGLIGLGMGMLLVNYLLSFPVWAYTPLGEWFGALYRYGMTTAWKDGLSILFAAVLWQWVWIPLGIHFAVDRCIAGKARSAQQR